MALVQAMSRLSIRMDLAAALLNDRSPQQLSATELDSRIALLEDAARAYRAERERRTLPDALSKLSGDVQGILFVQLCNVLDPGIAVALAASATSCARRRGCRCSS